MGSSVDQWLHVTGDAKDLGHKDKASSTELVYLRPFKSEKNDDPRLCLVGGSSDVLSGSMSS